MQIAGKLNKKRWGKERTRKRLFELNPLQIQGPQAVGHSGLESAKE